MSLYTMMLLEGLTDKKHPEGLITKKSSFRFISSFKVANYYIYKF